MGLIWLGCFIGMVFGAIHFLSWRSAFPTHTQLLLWRISSIVLVAEPFSLALLYLQVTLAADSDRAKGLWKALVSSLGYFFMLISMMLGPIVYIFARMALLVLAFLTLRNPPSPALQTISWTTYIPHL
ncbi:hypothetical protein BDN72DRAFT_782117 [Pluteus cervinus]|uniref:Uncharacterized protein n=1 Tax=Pluteus cervinus TaxID=181527 RepID=A0ACD2ZXZ0_9AGAR|nr:hypothetical protein BDN72DRAFT_782117 [Pluteus cervinus]